MSAVASVAAEDPAGAASALRRDGAVLVENVWPIAAIDMVRATVLGQHPEFENVEALEDWLGDKEERFIAPVALTEALRATGVLDTPALDAICAAALGEEFVFEAFGILMPRRGAKAQGAHRDGGFLFPDATIDPILPPSALTIAIPLVDIDLDNAPTGIAVGSHKLKPGSSDAPLAAVPAPRGSAIVWDFRTLHGGLANTSDRGRPALYFTACRPFWIDHRNFRDTARAKLVGDAATIAALGPRYIRAQAMQR